MRKQHSPQCSKNSNESPKAKKVKQTTRRITRLPTLERELEVFIEQYTEATKVWGETTCEHWYDKEIRENFLKKHPNEKLQLSQFLRAITSKNRLGEYHLQHTELQFLFDVELSFPLEFYTFTHGSTAAVTV